VRCTSPRWRSPRFTTSMGISLIPTRRRMWSASHLTWVFPPRSRPKHHQAGSRCPRPTLRRHPRTATRRIGRRPGRQEGRRVRPVGLRTRQMRPFRRRNRQHQNRDRSASHRAGMRLDPGEELATRRIRLQTVRPPNDKNDGSRSFGNGVLPARGWSRPFRVRTLEQIRSTRGAGMPYNACYEFHYQTLRRPRNVRVAWLRAPILRVCRVRAGKTARPAPGLAADPSRARESVRHARGRAARRARNRAGCRSDAVLDRTVELRTDKVVSQGRLKGRASAGSRLARPRAWCFGLPTGAYAVGPLETPPVNSPKKRVRPITWTVLRICVSRAFFRFPRASRC
jgi:hypothetical protein